LFNYVNLQEYISYKNTKSLFILNKYSMYLFIHVKLSTFFFNLRLLDIFSYEVFSSSNSSSTSDVTVYMFNSPNTTSYLYLFILQSLSYTSSPSYGSTSKLFSCTEFFYNASWLEREASELSGVLFLFKKDTRNLMLQFGDFSFPFKKKYPSIGFKEFFYNGLSDKILYKPISLQF
jgi:NADH:ubiquinone oxidoreductase subunit C